MIYDPDLFQIVPNPDYRLAAGDLCVERCPGEQVCLHTMRKVLKQNHTMVCWIKQFPAAGVSSPPVHCKKCKVNLIKLWSPQLHLNGYLHVVIKEHAHKCDPYSDPFSIPDLKNESMLRLSRSRFR